MAPCLTQEIVTLLYRSGDEIPGNTIAHRLSVDRLIVHRRLSTLVKKGWMSYRKPLGAPCGRYSVSSDQFERYIARANSPMARVELKDQDEERVARKLKFLTTLSRGVHADNPVLAELLADYELLRRRQSAAESKAMHK